MTSDEIQQYMDKSLAFDCPRMAAAGVDWIA